VRNEGLKVDLFLTRVQYFHGLFHLSPQMMRKLHPTGKIILKHPNAFRAAVVSLAEEDSAFIITLMWRSCNSKKTFSLPLVRNLLACDTHAELVVA
jgi:hypothetical protein